MHLEKLQVQGFKSFANKNVLVFPGMLDKTKRGITAVVGPNGSGKSNIADAIRWALGEQSMKTLRGKKSEDVIFSGSDKKGKLGMAEVSLFFNNEDRAGGMDYSEIVLSRRLYRNGDSEYLLNGSRARLSDIQIMLAKANFGQKTYSVIGQGLVEGFLNTSLAERKAFFDEATGVKQFQIKRDDSLNKLRASYENLSQVSMLLSEIEPRLRSLTKQVNKLEKRDEVKKELRSEQLRYYSFIWHGINSDFSRYNDKFLSYEKIKRDNDNKLENLNKELEKAEQENQSSEEIKEWQREINKLRQKREEYIRDLAQINAQLEIKLESKGRFDLSWLNSKKEELLTSIKRTEEEVGGFKNNIRNDKEKEALLFDEKRAIDDKLNKLNIELNNIRLKENKDKLGEKEDIKKALKKAFDSLRELDNENDLKLIKETIKKIRKEIGRLMDFADNEEDREKAGEIQKSIIDLSNKKEELFIKINESNLRISSRNERLKLLKEKIDSLEKELFGIEKKIKGSNNEIDPEKYEQEKKVVKEKLNKIDEEIKIISLKINEKEKQAEEKRNKVILIQKNIQSLQGDINSINRELGELQVNSTRYETKLEDLEMEIRHNYKDLAGVKKAEVDNNLDIDKTREKIDSLKRQLDLIGGIDPGVENEYKETKERYEFFHSQSSDLEKAIHSLEEIVKELDINIKEKFDKEFKVISKKFEEYFKILFNGGNAKIIKVMEDDENDENSASDQDEEKDNKKDSRDILAKNDIKRIKFLKKHNATGLAGIEIQATPPGKKIKSISMLSGGERALTAIAMISAIISANPAPFVVLDEVDAALDEANSERLAKILDDLSHKTQFIVITHNRASMRKASTLYGVTMGDDGISKLLSIKLEDVKAR
jgi:chromosome segregation protein